MTHLNCKQQLLLKSLLLSCLYLASGSVLALPSDSQQPVHIQADTVVWDETKGATTYTGNVVIEQGSINIHADIVNILNDDNRITQIIAHGTPVRLEQLTEIGQEPMQAQAETINYLITEESLTLEKRASLTKQDGSTINSEVITYNITNQIINAHSDSGKGTRVEMIIPAQQQTSKPTSVDDATSSEEIQ